VAVRRLGEIGVDFVLQKLMNMPEGLLLGQQRDIVLAGIVDQLLDLGGVSAAASFGAASFENQRLGLEIENVSMLKPSRLILYSASVRIWIFK